MRPLLPPAVLCLALHSTAQDQIPLPGEKAPDPLPPAATAPSLPRMTSGRRSATAPLTPGPAPKISMRPAPATGESSVHGGQFRVHGKIKEHRDILLEEAETTRRMVAAALRQDPSFSFPVVIQIRDTSALRPGLPPVWSAISLTGDGFRFEINLVPQHNAVPGPELRQELVRCILAEMLLRDHAGTDLTGRDTPPPDWLLHGVLELLEYQAMGRPSEAFSAVFRLGRVLSIDDIFAADPRPMDSVSRMIYRSSCCGLLLTLMEQKNGAEHLRELFKILAPMAGDDATAIARTFPRLNASGNSLGKWWSLQLATMSQPGLDELLSAGETESELAKALIISIPETTVPSPPQKTKGGGLNRIFSKKNKPAGDGKKDPEPAVTTTPASSVPLSDISRILDHPSRNSLLAGAGLALTKLSLRAHPLYRPVLGEYRALIRELSTGKKFKEAPAKLTELEALRRKLAADLVRIDDYMNWYEATQLEGMSSAFRDYLKADAEIRRPPAPRRDPLSRYMDLMEQEFSE